jgi:hypothetical protein
MVRTLERYNLEQDGKIDTIINKGVITIAQNLETVKFNLKDKLEMAAH